MIAAPKAVIAGVALCCGVASFAGGARADEGVPSGKIGAFFAGRQNVGELADRYSLGVMWGVYAGYQPSTIARPWSLGVDWSVAWGRFFVSDPRLVGGSLQVLEVSLGTRLRWLLEEGSARFWTLSGGASLVRTSAAIPPDDDRLLVAPYVGLGVETVLGGRGVLAIDARYAGIGSGPASLSILIGFALGS
ncbi:MAG TPA: hypothetical protein VFG83_02140 [Kofleriaceae bacterium]|nr:hypothetical protein [Kofleriaceae bacterium]